MGMTQIYSQKDLAGDVSKLSPFPIGTPSGCSITLNNQSPYGVSVTQVGTGTQVAYLQPYTYLTMPVSSSLQVQMDNTVQTSMNQPYQSVSYTTITGSVQYQSGSLFFGGPQDINMVNDQITVNINNSSLTITGTVAISGTPSVSISGTATVNIANTPAVTLSGTNTVNIGNTPAVTLSGTNNSVNIANTPTVAIDAANNNVNIANTPSVTVNNQSIAVTNTSGGSLTIAGTVSISATNNTVNIGNTPSVTITGTASVSISNTPAVTIQSGSISIANTPNVNVTNNINIQNTKDSSGNPVPVMIAGSISLSGTNTVNIGNTPSVTISGTASVNIANVPAVTLSGTNTVNIGNTPSVNVANNISVQNVAGGSLTVAGTVSISSTNNQVNIANSPTVKIDSASNTVNIGNTPSVNINSGAVNATIQNSQINTSLVDQFISADGFMKVGGGEYDAPAGSSGQTVNGTVSSQLPTNNQSSRGYNVFYFTYYCPDGAPSNLSVSASFNGVVWNGTLTQVSIASGPASTYVYKYKLNDILPVDTFNVSSTINVSSQVQLNYFDVTIYGGIDSRRDTQFTGYGSPKLFINYSAATLASGPQYPKSGILNRTAIKRTMYVINTMNVAFTGNVQCMDSVGISNIGSGSISVNVAANSSIAYTSDQYPQLSAQLDTLALNSGTATGATTGSVSIYITEI